MSLKKFEQNDIFKNVLKTTPQFNFKIYRGERYLNNSLNGYSTLNNMQFAPDLTAPTTSSCAVQYGMDFSCQDNSYNIALI